MISMEVEMENVLALDRRETKEVNFAVVVELIKMSMKGILKVGLIGIVCYNIYVANDTMNQSRITPMKIESTETKELKRTKEALALLKLSPEKIPQYADGIIMSAKVAGVDPVLLACLYYTESRFSLTAKSRMGFKGIAQTPTSTGYVASDMVHGADKLREKMESNNNDIHAALTNYKGSKFKKGTAGYKQASEVLVLYASLNKQIKG
jgi:hypothetical protein